MRKYQLLILIVLAFFFCIGTIAFADEAVSVSAKSNLLVEGGIVAMIISGAIGLLKKVNLPTAICPIVAFVLGAAVGVGAYFMGFADGLSLIEAVIAGAGVGGVSTGLYDLKKTITSASS